MSVEHFLDTNVFVYLFDEAHDAKRERSVRLATVGRVSGA